MTLTLAFLFGLSVAIPLAYLIFYIDRWRREERMLQMMRPRNVGNCELLTPHKSRPLNVRTLQPKPRTAA